MTSPALPAARLAICIDAGRRNAGELIRTLSTQHGADQCALLLHACASEDETTTQAHHLALAAFPGPNAVHLASAERGRKNARDWLVAHAPASWILFLDPADMPGAPDFLKDHLGAAAAADKPSAIFGGMVASAAQPNPTPSLAASASPDLFAPLDMRATDPGRFFSSSNLLVHRDLLSDCDFDDGFACRAHRDIDWALRLEAAHPLIHIDNPVVRTIHDEDASILEAAAEAGSSLARLIQRHPGLATRLPLIASARRVKGLPLLAPAARALAASPVLPTSLRATAFRVYAAAACSPFIEPA